ncbi:MAG: hemerythrin domain-containing protein [Sphingobacteriales bacterium]|nr:hemerythrin domain-containing protein [Sphingobacteriales bacterium]
MTNIFSESDYLKRNVEKDANGQPGYSPMDPPDAYKPPGIEPVAYELLDPVLRHLYDEHKFILAGLDDLEKALLEIRKEGINKSLNKKLADFFKFLDEFIVLHHLKEERILFPLLHDRLLDAGEHAPGSIPETAVDMLENDHIKTMQLVTLMFSLMGLSSRLTDLSSRAILIDTAIEQGNSLIELLRLHIFRENNVVFALAHKYFTNEDFQEQKDQLKKYFSIAL